MLQDGHQRFRSGHRLTRDLGRAVHDTAAGQYPLAVILSCIDSRSPAELIFDLGVGDIFSVRIAGNVPSRKVLGSIEYACAVVGAKLVLVMGHTRCGAVTTAVDRAAEIDSAAPDDCHNVEFILREIREAMDEPTLRAVRRASVEQRETLVDAVACSNVLRTVAEIRRQSSVLETLEREGRIAVVGAMYDVACGGITFLSDGTDDGQLQTASGEPVTSPVYESDLSPGS
jgi:carbonic anhydrase/SulP family sulfate permease